MEKVAKRLERTKLSEGGEEDEELGAEERGAFSDVWLPLAALPAPAPVLRSHHAPSDGASVAVGLTNGTLGLLYVERLEQTMLQNLCFSHKGLSDVRCSNVSPGIVYSSSASEGNILMWDGRTNGKSPVMSFSVGKGLKIGGGKRKTSGEEKIKPILTFDVSQNDQVVCGGTEKVDEDSYLLFWDVRSSKLLGAYWESHSDDVTAVKFHPSGTHSLTTGSTDGLLNVFNLLEASEDDALLFSLNTESSVESLAWVCSNEAAASAAAFVPPLTSTSSLPASTISAVTHTNDVQLWDSTSGDQFCVFDRSRIAEGMKRSNPDAVYVTGCYVTSSNSPLGILSCSVSGGACRFLSISGNQLLPSGLFPDQKSVVVTAQFLPKFNRWITCDDDGLIKTWRQTIDATKEPSLIIKEKTIYKKHKEKPYSKRLAEKEIKKM